MEQESTDIDVELKDSLIELGDTSPANTEASITDEFLEQPSNERWSSDIRLELVEHDIEYRDSHSQSIGSHDLDLDAGESDSQRFDEASAEPVVDRAQEAVISDPFVPLPYTPTSSGEDIRRSGLAWSAGVAFFGSVAFTLFLGWLADLLLGTSPWGIVGGIILGSMIGFLQFFRLTSRIFPQKNDAPSVSPLMSSKDDDQV